MKLGDIPAFPSDGDTFTRGGPAGRVTQETYSGMTLRQYYAGLAMQSVTEVIFPKMFEALANEKSRNLTDAESDKLKKLLPELAVACADALLAQLEKGQ